MPALASRLLIAVLAVFDAAPFVLLLPLPRTGLYTGGGLILLLGLGTLGACVGNRLTRPGRYPLMAVFVAGAAINLLTAVLMRVLPPGFLNAVISGAIGSLLGVDGEYAGVADGYELWCKIWFSIALACWAIARAIRGRTGARLEAGGHQSG